MPQSILHIGAPKTGSTAIQLALMENQDGLRRAGLRYPTFLRGANHMELVAYAADEPDERFKKLVGISSASELEAFRSRFKALFLAETEGASWVFSSEHMSSRLRSEKSLSRLAELMSGLDTRVIYYARRQDEMASASHSTWVRSGDPRSFDIETHIANVDRYDHKTLVERWDRAFGSDAVDVRLYPTRSGKSVVEDFLETAGVEGYDRWSFPPRSNVSLDSKAAAFVREMNRRLPRWEDGPTARFLDMSDAVLNVADAPPLRLAPDQQRRLMERFRESNAWILERASNAASSPRYFDVREDAGSGTMQEELTMDEVLEFARALWVRLSATEKRLRRAQEDT